MEAREQPLEEVVTDFDTELPELKLAQTGDTLLLSKSIASALEARWIQMTMFQMLLLLDLLYLIL